MNFRKIGTPVALALTVSLGASGLSAKKAIAGGYPMPGPVSPVNVGVNVSSFLSGQGIGATRVISVQHAELSTVFGPDGNLMLDTYSATTMLEQGASLDPVQLIVENGQVSEISSGKIHGALIVQGYNGLYVVTIDPTTGSPMITSIQSPMPPAMPL